MYEMYFVKLQGKHPSLVYTTNPNCYLYNTEILVHGYVTTKFKIYLRVKNKY